MEQVSVSRSGLRMWALAVAGVPMAVMGIDLLLRRRIFAALTPLVFTGDPQLVEPRDVIWAVVLLILGLIFLAFGLRDLLFPAPVMLADGRGLHLQLGHPLSRPVTIPWGEVDDIGSEDLNDDGSVVPVLWIKVSNPARLPANPWGARWIESDTLAVMAADWERHPRLVARAATDVALAAASLNQHVSKSPASGRPPSVPNEVFGPNELSGPDEWATRDEWGDFR